MLLAATCSTARLVAVRLRSHLDQSPAIKEVPEAARTACLVWMGATWWPCCITIHGDLMVVTPRHCFQEVALVLSDAIISLKERTVMVTCQALLQASDVSTPQVHLRFWQTDGATAWVAKATEAAARSKNFYRSAAFIEQQQRTLYEETAATQSASSSSSSQETASSTEDSAPLGASEEASEEWPSQGQSRESTSRHQEAVVANAFAVKVFSSLGLAPQLAPSGDEGSRVALLQTRFQSPPRAVVRDVLRACPPVQAGKRRPA